jgi:hypothetical protein
MSVLSPAQPRELGRDRPSPARRARWALLALALVAVPLGAELDSALQSPGQAIRGELKAAAAELERPQVQASEAVLRRLRDHFPRRQVTIDARSWPLVLLTLHGVDKSSCSDAASAARRIEGLVVVELEGYQAAGDCHAENDMTWRIMP